MIPLTDAFRENERMLWGLSYRVTGVAADADEIVQDAFIRLMEHPPPDQERSVRPWLVHVCVNLARDRLRARRRRAYQGPWLPSPVPDERLGAETKLDIAHHASTAFLLALEALTPKQRAVLVLRDVFELSAEETALALDSTAAAVRVAHHRARQALHSAPSNGPADTDPGRTAAALTAFLSAIASGDLPGACAILAPDVRLYSDANGDFLAAGVAVVGPDRVVRFVHKLSTGVGELRWAIVSLNGLPALVGESLTPAERRAPRFTLSVRLDATGRIHAMDWVLATRKLTAVGPVPRP